MAMFRYVFRWYHNWINVGDADSDTVDDDVGIANSW